MEHQPNSRMIDPPPPNRRAAGPRPVQQGARRGPRPAGRHPRPGGPRHRSDLLPRRGRGGGRRESRHRRAARATGGRGRGRPRAGRAGRARLPLAGPQPLPHPGQPERLADRQGVGQGVTQAAGQPEAEEDEDRAGTPQAGRRAHPGADGQRQGDRRRRRRAEDSAPGPGRRRRHRDAGEHAAQLRQRRAARVAELPAPGDRLGPRLGRAVPAAPQQRLGQRTRT